MFCRNTFCPDACAHDWRDAAILIGPKRVTAVTEFLAEHDLMTLLQDRLVEPFANAVCLRGPHFGLRVADVVDRQNELTVVFVDPPAKFSAPVGHDPQHFRSCFSFSKACTCVSGRIAPSSANLVSNAFSP